MNFIKYIFYGIIFGVSNVIPGVSGGTMAIVFNFYDLLTESITLNFKILKKNIMFIIPFGFGIIIGIFVFASIISFLLENYTTSTYFGLIGIVLGSTPLIINKVKADPIKPLSYIFGIIALGIMIAFIFVNEEGSGSILYNTLSIESFIVLLLSLVIAAATMIIPGISGSLMLIVMGTYPTVINIVKTFDITLMIPVLLGALIGLLGGAKLITIVLKKYKQYTYMAILGLVIGSIFPLIKNSSITNLDATIIVPIICLIVMSIIIYMFSRYEIKNEKGE